MTLINEYSTPAPIQSVNLGTLVCAKGSDTAIPKVELVMKRPKPVALHDRKELDDAVHVWVRVMKLDQYLLDIWESVTVELTKRCPFSMLYVDLEHVDPGMAERGHDSVERVHRSDA